MTKRDASFMNKLDDQALRMSKVKQQISEGFRTTQGADTFFTIRSYLATMHKQQTCLFDCLVSTSRASLFGVAWLAEQSSYKKFASGAYRVGDALGAGPGLLGVARLHHHP